MAKKTKPAPAPDMVSVPIKSLCGVMLIASYDSSVPYQPRVVSFHSKRQDHNTPFRSDFLAAHRAMLAHERAKRKTR